MRRLTARHVLELTDDPVVLDAFLAIMRRWAGKRIPRAPSHLLRDAEIRQALDRGDSYQVVAERYNLTATRIKQIGKDHW